MGRMGLLAIYRKVNTSKPNKAHKKYPYLLRGIPIKRINQVWSTDITYIRLKGGFVFLCGVIDWYSRYVLSWRLSMTLEGRAIDNVFVERLRKTVKYEDVYIKCYESVSECKKGLTEFFERYNDRREHSSLLYNYPAEIYFGKVILPQAA